MAKDTFYTKTYFHKDIFKSIFSVALLFGTAQFANSQCSTSRIPNSDCSFDYVIDSFTLDGITAVTTGCSGNQLGYTNFGSTYAFELFAGSQVNVSATMGNHYNKQGLAVWIDFNNNGYFESSEYVYSAAADTSVAGTITIPFTAIATTVKMRVITADQTPPANAACIGHSFYGETEDHDLLIKPISANNAAVWALDSPAFFCAGQQDIYVGIGNAGINQIDSVEIHWEFNGLLQPIVKHSQLLDTLNGSSPSSSQVFLATKNFAFGSSNQIKIWTSLPNGVLDTFNLDDTLLIHKKAALAGSYTIDPNSAASSTNYQSFSLLAFELNNYGLCGPVYVDVSPGIYQDYLYLEEVWGTNSNNSITIDGQDSSICILSHDGSSSYATVTLDNTDYVTIKNLHIEGANANWGASLLLTNGAQHNSIDNSVLKIDSSLTSFEKTNIQIIGNATSYNSLSNNKIDGGARALYMDMEANSANVENKILDNEIFNIYAKGIVAIGQDFLELKGNHIDVFSMGYAQGNAVEILASNNSIVSKNYIHSAALGLRIDNYQTFSAAIRKIEISNNMIISDKEGIGISDVDSIAIFHNSISVNGLGAALSVISFTSASNYDLRNNILSSLHGAAFSSTQPAAIFSKMDHNIYYSVDGTVLLSVDTNNYADLLTFKNDFPSLNSSSHEGNPQFVSAANDLHILGTLANDKGDNTVGILEDFDGEVRPSSSSNIDIGADEYSPQSCPPLYGLTAFDPGLDSISLYWNAATAGYYQYEILPKGNAQGSGIVDTSTLNQIRIGNLMEATAYELYVRNICSRGDTSIWWGPYEFYTSNKVPYSEDFETFNSTALTNAWSTDTYIAPQWKSASITPYGAVIKDHTIGSGGTFAYLNSSYAPGRSNLTSPTIYVDTNQKILEFSFWYFMNGADMGDLKVYILSNGISKLIASISGAQQSSATDSWLEFSTYLTSYAGESIQIQFEATKGFGANSEMAIDDVSLDSISTFDAGIIGFNPVFSIDSCYSSNQNIDIYLINNGNSAIDFTVDTAWLTVNISNANSQNYMKVLADNSLNNGMDLQIGDTLLVPMGTLNMSGIGTYEFDSYLRINKDSIHTNNTFWNSIERTKASAGTVAGNDSICGADTVTLSSTGTIGQIQWQRLAAGNFIDEIGANSKNYKVFIDSTTHFRLLACNTEISDTLTLISNLIPSMPITFSDTSVVFCGDSGTAVLRATSNLTNASFRWYNDSSSTQVLDTGSTYYFGRVTSFQSRIATDTFYVSVVDPSSACESPRNLVVGTVFCFHGQAEFSNQSGSVNILPNPSNGMFTFRGNHIEGELKTSLYNSSGKLVFERNYSSSEEFVEMINISGLSKGIYFMKIKADNIFEIKKVLIY